MKGKISPEESNRVNEIYTKFENELNELLKDPFYRVDKAVRDYINRALEKVRILYYRNSITREMNDELIEKLFKLSGEKVYEIRKDDIFLDKKIPPKKYIFKGASTEYSDIVFTIAGNHIFEGASTEYSNLLYTIKDCHIFEGNSDTYSDVAFTIKDIAQEEKSVDIETPITKEEKIIVESEEPIITKDKITNRPNQQPIKQEKASVFSQLMNERIKKEDDNKNFFQCPYCKNKKEIKNRIQIIIDGSKSVVCPECLERLKKSGKHVSVLKTS